MVQDLMEYVKANRPGTFCAVPHYFGEGDFVTYYATDEPAFEERIDEVVTIYREMSSKTLIGCKIKGVRRLLEEFEAWGVVICDGDVALGFLFYAAAQQKPEKTEEYKEVSSRFGKARVQVPAAA